MGGDKYTMYCWCVARSHITMFWSDPKVRNEVYTCLNGREWTIIHYPNTITCLPIKIYTNMRGDKYTIYCWYVARSHIAIFWSDPKVRNEAYSCLNDQEWTTIHYHNTITCIPISVLCTILISVQISSYICARTHIKWP